MLKFSGLVIWRLGSRTSLRKYSGPSVTGFKAELSRNVTEKNVDTNSVETKNGPSK